MLMMKMILTATGEIDVIPISIGEHQEAVYSWEIWLYIVQCIRCTCILFYMFKLTCDENESWMLKQKKNTTAYSYIH